MNRIEHLLTILSEECAEVIQNVSKALRFGLEDKYESTTNAENITKELADLFGVIDMLKNEGIIKMPMLYDILEKQKKVEKYLKYSKSVNTLDEKTDVSIESLCCENCKHGKLIGSLYPCYNCENFNKWERRSYIFKKVCLGCKNIKHLEDATFPCNCCNNGMKWEKEIPEDEIRKSCNNCDFRNTIHRCNECSDFNNWRYKKL